MSKPATIQLVRSFYPDIELNANQGYVPAATGEVEIKTAVEMQLRPHDQMAGVWVVGITIELTWPELELPPYGKARLVHFGIFEVNTEMPSDVLEKHLTISAPSMLYSGAREFVKILTASGPYPPVMLPSIQFRHVKVAAMNESEVDGAETEV